MNKHKQCCTSKMRAKHSLILFTLATALVLREREGRTEVHLEGLGFPTSLRKELPDIKRLGWREAGKDVVQGPRPSWPQLLALGDCINWVMFQRLECFCRGRQSPLQVWLPFWSFVGMKTFSYFISLVQGKVWLWLVMILQWLNDEDDLNNILRCIEL